MVAYANEHNSSDCVNFAELDIASTSEPRQVFPLGFHKIFSLYCLHWVKDLPRAVSNLAALLLPGGEALLVFLASNPIFRMYRAMAASSKWGALLTDVERYIPVYQA